MKQHDTKFLRLFFTSVTIFFLVEIITSPQKVAPTYEIVINTLSPETRKWFIKAIENSLNNDAPFEGKYSLTRPDGSMRYTHTIGKVIRNRIKSLFLCSE